MAAYLSSIWRCWVGSVFAVTVWKTSTFYMYINKVHYACRCLLNFIGILPQKEAYFLRLYMSVCIYVCQAQQQQIRLWDCFTSAYSHIFSIAGANLPRLPQIHPSQKALVKPMVLSLLLGPQIQAPSIHTKQKPASVSWKIITVLCAVFTWQETKRDV